MFCERLQNTGIYFLIPSLLGAHNGADCFKSSGVFKNILKINRACIFFSSENAIKSNHRFPEERIHRTMHFNCQLFLHAVPVILAFSTAN